MLIDVHCHLDFEAFDRDRVDVLSRAHAAGVSDVVLPGVSRAQWAAAHGVTRWEAGLPPCRHVCVGVHPAWLATERPSREVLRAAVESVRPVAIGEFGLDVRVGGPEAALVQEDVAVDHLTVAREADLPVVLHVVRRHGRMFELLDEHAPPGGFVHGFTGAAEVALGYAERGLAVSFGFKLLDRAAKKARAAACALPLDRLLVESDAPRPKGERGEPAGVQAIVGELARLRGAKPSEIARATTANARRILGLSAA